MRGPHLRGRRGFVVDLTPPGARPRKQARRRGFPTKKAAQAALTEILGRLAVDEYVAPRRQTLGDYLETTWLPAVESTLRPSTWQSYRRVLRRHVIAHPIAGIQLQGVTAPALNKLYSELLAGVDDRRALSARSAAYIAAILHRALRDAVRWHLLVRNPAGAADPPKVRSQKRREIKTWPAADLGRFLTATADDRLGPLWRLLAATGCRRGEALGLRWSDLDPEAAKMRVVQTVIETEGAPGYAFSTPKTDRGRRTIALDAATVATLRSHRAQQSAQRLAVGAGWRDHDLVFCRPDGEPLHPKSVSSLFADAVKRHSLPQLSVHGLRHTWATLAMASGVHPRVVQQRLGHSQIAVTLDIYSHVTDGMDDAAAESVAALIWGGSA